ncbi:hypothetical protein [Shewanella waksmanii]|uniref:hypothetical protein n=1 Tax=Shewanella waksmanii TaxID=213783 RepID=UPI00048F44F3|nr:hypothetical protein [Shewanella waksmanii]
MKKIIIGIWSLLISFYVCASPPPPSIPGNPILYSECSVDNIIELEAEFDIPKFKKYEIPKGEKFTKCFKLTGHSDDVGLLVVRTAVTNNDKITVEKGPYEEQLSLPMQTVSREIFNLSDSFNATRQDQILYPRFSTEVSTQDREIIFGYELTSQGSFALTVGVTTDDPMRYVPNKDEVPSSISEPRTSASIPALLNIEGVSSGVNSALFYGTQGSNVGNCPVNSLPPANINRVKPVNASLSILEGQKGSYYSDDPALQKGIDIFFQGGAEQKYGNKAALASTAFLVANRYSNNKEQYSFMVGAAAKVAGSSSAAAIIGTVGGSIDNALVNRGSNYASVYLKDPNRHNIQDSCNREPIKKPGRCTVPERHIRFDMPFKNRTWFEKNPFNYGEGVNLLFKIDAFSFADDLWVVATGGNNNSSRRLFSIYNLMNKMEKVIFNYSTETSGEIYMNAMGRVNNSAIEVKVLCTVTSSTGSNKGEGDIIIYPPWTPEPTDEI